MNYVDRILMLKNFASNTCQCLNSNLYRHENPPFQVFKPTTKCESNHVSSCHLRPILQCLPSRELSESQSHSLSNRHQENTKSKMNKNQFQFDTTICLLFSLLSTNVHTSFLARQLGLKRLVMFKVRSKVWKGNFSGLNINFSDSNLTQTYNPLMKFTHSPIPTFSVFISLVFPPKLRLNKNTRQVSKDIEHHANITHFSLLFCFFFQIYFSFSFFLFFI